MAADEDGEDEGEVRGVRVSKQEFQVCGEFTLGAGETKVVEGTIQLPPTLQPSFDGRYTKNLYQVQGRREAKGNDPDSGWKPIRIVVPA